MLVVIHKTLSEISTQEALIDMLVVPQVTKKGQ